MNLLHLQKRRLSPIAINQSHNNGNAVVYYVCLCVCDVVIGHQAHTLAFDFFYHSPGHAVLRKAIDTDNTMKLKKDRRKPLRKTTSTSTSPMEAPRPSTSRRKGLSFSDVGCREQIDQITKCIECEFETCEFYTNHQVHESRGNVLSIRLMGVDKLISSYNKSKPSRPIQTLSIKGKEFYSLGFSVSVAPSKTQKIGRKRKKLKQCRVKNKPNAKVNRMWKDLSKNQIALRFLKDCAKDSILESTDNSLDTIYYRIYVQKSSVSHLDSERNRCHNYYAYLRPCFNGDAIVTVAFEGGLYKYSSEWMVRSLWEGYRQQTNSQKKKYRDKYFSKFSRQHRDGRMKRNEETQAEEAASKIETPRRKPSSSKRTCGRETAGLTPQSNVKVLLDEDEQGEVEMKNVAVIMLDLFRPVVLKKDNCK